MIRTAAAAAAAQAMAILTVISSDRHRQNMLPE
jgi:hypothetical protein